jgi:predicted RNase H-like HicB family nuclease
MHKYGIILHWNEEDGSTMRQAVESAEVVIAEWIEAAKTMGRGIPGPRGRLKFA